jgi:hypothetical protein
VLPPLVFTTVPVLVTVLVLLLPPLVMVVLADPMPSPSASPVLAVPVSALKLLTDCVFAAVVAPLPVVELAVVLPALAVV